MRCKLIRLPLFSLPSVCPILSLQGGGNLTCDYEFWLGATCNVMCPGANPQTTRCIWNDNGQYTEGTWDPPPDQCVGKYVTQPSANEHVTAVKPSE